MELSTKRLKLIVLVFLLLAGAATAQQRHTLTGDVRLRQNFHSNILNNDRDVIVYLPPGYGANGTKHYPVFYMHDGQNLFDGATAFIPGQEWRVDEVAQSLIAAEKIEPLIIVGIYNAGVERVNEYRSEEHTSELQSQSNLVCRLLLE